VAKFFFEGPKMALDRERSRNDYFSRAGILNGLEVNSNDGCFFPGRSISPDLRARISAALYHSLDPEGRLPRGKITEISNTYGISRRTVKRILDTLIPARNTAIIIGTSEYRVVCRMDQKKPTSIGIYKKEVQYFSLQKSKP